MKPVKIDHPQAIRYEIGTIAELDVLPYRSSGGHTVMLSLWKPSPEELEAMVAGKPVRLHIITNQHPFVKVDVEISS